MSDFRCHENFRHFSLQSWTILKLYFLWIVATTTNIFTRDYLINVQTLYFIINFIFQFRFYSKIWISTSSYKSKFIYCVISIVQYKYLLIFAFSAIHFRNIFIRRVSCYTLLSEYQLPWPSPRCLDENIFFMGSRLRQKFWHI